MPFPWLKLIRTGIQVTGGSVLAVYAMKGTNSPFLKFLGNWIAFEGGCDLFEILWKRFVENGETQADDSQHIPYWLPAQVVCSTTLVLGLVKLLESREEILQIATSSLCHFASIVLHINSQEAMKIFWRASPIEKTAMARLLIGTVTYSVTVYAFNEICECNDKLWLPCIGTTVCGYYTAVTAMKRLETIFNRNRFLKFCRLSFQPALLLYGDLCLLHYQNNEESRILYKMMNILYIIDESIISRRRDDLQ